MTKTEMMRAMKGLACLAAAIALPACAKAQEIAAGKVAFDADCSLCHDASPARATFQGPPLFGVVGRKTGAVSGFAYSAALKSAGAKGKVWTAAALDRFLTDPQKAMPGTAMPVSVARRAQASGSDRSATAANGDMSVRYRRAGPSPSAKPACGPVSAFQAGSSSRCIPSAWHSVLSQAASAEGVG